jgi:hypothetical protein
VVTAVDPQGPCAGQIAAGFGIRKINDAPVTDREAYAEVSAGLKPGSEVAIEGIYVPNRAGRRGSWKVGRAIVRLRDAPKERVAGTPKATETPDPEAQGSTRPAIPHAEPEAPGKQTANSDTPTEDLEAPDATLAPDDRNVPGNSQNADIPYIPLGLSIDGFPDYDRNDEAFAACDYSVGPNGEKIYTLYAVVDCGDLGFVPVTREGFVEGEEGAGLASLKPSERQDALLAALNEKRFRLHGRALTWNVSGALPKVADVLGEEGYKEHVPQGQESEVYKGAVKPIVCCYFFDGLPHGVRRQWKDDGYVSVTPVVHGMNHFEQRKEFPDGRTVLVKWRFGTKHGVLRGHYTSSGAPYLEGELRNGLLEGNETQWYEDGQVRLRCHWKNNKLDGKMEEFHPNGTKKSVSVWAAGDLSENELVWDDEGNALQGRGKALTPYEQGREQGLKLGRTHRLVGNQSLISETSSDLNIQFEDLKQRRHPRAEYFEGRLHGYISGVGGL